MTMDDSRDAVAHVYDGIEEYDNPLPGWWTFIFWATVWFSLAYVALSLIRRDWFDPHLRFEAAQTRVLQQQFSQLGDLEPDEGTLLGFLEDEDKAKWLAVGEAVVRTNCVSCHGRSGEGVSAPNLTDHHYKHVKVLTDFPTVIKNGAAGGAMPAWGNRLLENEVILVAAYVASLRGGLVQGREPEGETIPVWGAASEAGAGD